MVSLIQGIRSTFATHFNWVPNGIPGADWHLIPEASSQEIVVRKVGNVLDQSHGSDFFHARLDVISWEATEESHVVASVKGHERRERQIKDC